VIQNQIQQEKKHWHEILERLLATIQCLASYNTAFRGLRDGLERERSGNFLDQVKFDPVLQERLHCIEDNGVHNYYFGKKTRRNQLQLKN
jgi:hypothetical protein